MEAEPTTIFIHHNPPKFDNRGFPIDHYGQTAELRLCPVEGPDTEFPGRPVGPTLPRCKQDGCFNMLLWITDDLATSTALGTVCGNCGDVVKNPFEDKGNNTCFYALTHAETKCYLVRMMVWEMETAAWGRQGKEYDEAISRTYGCYLSSTDNLVERLVTALAIATNVRAKRRENLGYKNNGQSSKGL